MLITSLQALAAASCFTSDAPLDPRYAPDHQNYLCMNYTRATPLPCKPAADSWTPNWFKPGKQRRRRFIIYAWWPPVPADLDAYVDAGFNLALTENFLGGYCNQREVVTHDELFNENIAVSNTFAKRGILTVFNTGNACNKQLALSPTVAYGNKTGGTIEGHTNITAKGPGATRKEGDRAYTKGQTVPELQYITSELQKRGVLDQFAGIQMHDDTEVQTGETIDGANWLHEHAKSFVPFVNQVGGVSGPQTLYRSNLFISAPEEYAINCPNSDCHNVSTAFNATLAAMHQLDSYIQNAEVDLRFGLDSWPLSHIGDGQGPLNSSNPDISDPPANNVRSDSLVRWMGYAALAYGATGLNWYCWSGGIYWTARAKGEHGPGRPSPMYQTVKEINADAGAWGDELLGNGFGFSGALHTGWMGVFKKGGGRPTSKTIVTSMSDDLLVGVFVPSEMRGGGGGGMEEEEEGGDVPDAYLLVVSKEVSGQVAALPARNVTLILHPSVGCAVVAPTGHQGPRGFEELYAKHRVQRPKPGPRRHQWSRVVRQSNRGEDAGLAVRVTVEVVGGGGAMIRLYSAKRAGGPSSSSSSALLDACFSMVHWSYDPSTVSMATLKAPYWAYDSWPARYRPYENLEITGGRSFEEGEQTPFLIGASFAKADPPIAADDAKAWAWSGINLMSLSAPKPSDLKSYGPASQAIGTVLDYGYPFGFFVSVEPPEFTTRGQITLLPSEVTALSQTFRCHGRWFGLLLANNVSTDPLSLKAISAAATALRISGRWALPLALTTTPQAAIEVGSMYGVSLAMPTTPPLSASATTAPPGNATVIEWAQAVAHTYEPMRSMLAASYSLRDPLPSDEKTRGRVGTYVSHASMAFVAALDACVSDSDSMLRFAAFTALAYGARGLFWRGAGACAPIGSPRFTLLASINKRIAQWGNVFVSSKDGTQDYSDGGYNITKLYATGYPLPSAVKPGSGGASDLVQSADDDVLIAELGSQGRYATPLLYVVDKRVELQPGAAKVRTLHVTLRGDVTATQPLEGDCAASRCQCGLSNVGSTIAIRLPGGSGQLVALSLWDGRAAA